MGAEAGGAEVEEAVVEVEEAAEVEIGGALAAKIEEALAEVAEAAELALTEVVEIVRDVLFEAVREAFVALLCAVSGASLLIHDISPVYECPRYAFSRTVNSVPS